MRGGQEMGRQWYEDGKVVQKEKHVQSTLLTALNF
jgi:protease II